MVKPTLFTVAKIWKQLKCSSTDKWIKKMCIYTQWKITQHKKRMKFCHLPNMDGLEGHYAK